MHIMLFGGAFDPPHNGHLQIVRTILEQQLADDVLFVPCAQHPFGKQMSPAADRLEMLRRADAGAISTFEIEKTTTSFTIDTLEHFFQAQPEDSYSWLIGSDQLPTFNRWHRWEDILALTEVYVYPRENYPFSNLYPGMVALQSLPVISISSTLVRNLISSNQPISHLVPKAVAQYIYEKKLYAPA